MSGIVYHETLTLEKVLDWLDTAKPGSKLEYHRGHLCSDRETVVTLDSGQVAHVFHEPLNAVAHVLYRAYEKGKVTLYQKKDPELGPYRYFAQKRKR